MHDASTVGGAAQIEAGYVCWRIQRLTQDKQTLENRRLAGIVATKNDGQWRQQDFPAIRKRLKILDANGC